MKEIPLSQGKFAIVDNENFEELSKYKWTAIRTRKTKDKFYAYRNETIESKRKSIYMHRVIMNPSKGLVVDHIDGNTLNNTKNNLRICKNSENLQNQDKSGKNKYKGAYRVKSKTELWFSHICVNKKRYYLGTFKTEIEAANAYNEASERLHGKFGQKNIIKY